jgi:exopolysaccharide production protein ExoZ
MNRLPFLDYLRGLAALGIMIYHYLVWTLGKFSSDSFMGRYGIYGVSIFYILSGLTLYHVYQVKFQFTKVDLLDFFKKRFFRIFPLLWLIILVSIFLDKKTPHLITILLNLSGTFGLINWDGYIGTGVWSIGNELVFYLFFPILILLSKKAKSAFFLLSLSLFWIYLNFAFNILDPNKTIIVQWRNYVNPLNQAFLFLGGFLIGFLFQNITIKKNILLFLFVLGTTIFIFYPVSGPTIYLVTGFNRLVFTFSCFLICLSCYKFYHPVHTAMHKPLSLLGKTSYSIYMLHPLVFTASGFILAFSNKYFIEPPIYVQFAGSAILTLFLSYFSYQYFEKYFIDLSRPTKRVSPSFEVTEKIL